ncbi:MAG: hypothetical protein U0871_27770 [Gemmataceae bacterium]
MRKLLVPSAVTVGCLAAVAAGQIPAPPVATVTTAKAVVVGQPVKAAPAKDGKPADKGKADAKEAKKEEPKVEPPKATPRMEKLKKLEVDRRPSSVLKAWAPEPKPDPGKTPPKPDPVDAEIAAYKKAVTLGQWDKVKAYLASLPDEEATAAYKQTVAALQRQQGPQMPQQGDGTPDEMRQMMMMNTPAAQQYGERNSFTVDDVFGLAAAAPRSPNAKLLPPRMAVGGGLPVAHLAPRGLEREHLGGLGQILAMALNTGTLAEVAVAKLKAEVAKPADRAALTKRDAAKLLTFAGHPEYAGDFLPTPEQAVADRDGEALNLLARYFLARHGRDDKGGTANLEKAWHAVQAVLTFPGATREQSDEALLRAVELAPRITDALGQAWLNDSFTKNPDRGMEILAKVGTLVAQGLPTRPFQPDDRLNALKLMRTAVDALLKAAPQKADAWSPTLSLLAAAWLKEAEFSRQFAPDEGPQLRQDRYGNIYYGMMDDGPGYSPYRYQNPNQPRPIGVSEVMKAKPSDAWVGRVDDGFRPKLAGLIAQLHLKAGEEDEAFPLIEQVAKAQPDEAKSLVREFLTVWTRNHNPNENRNRYRYSWFFYGFENRAESIPLTRSKQERNLQELSEWAARIRKLPIPELDEDIWVRAFTACHSSAEVYKTEAIEKVFGPLGGLKPKTLAGLAQQMRTNLTGLWRDPNEQQQKKTNRKKKDLEAEVMRGYQVARKSVADGLGKFPGDWSLLLAEACLMHDEVNYKQELEKKSDFSTNRTAALARFAEAAAAYAKAAPKLTEDEYTTQPHELWLYASLGAVDLGMIAEDKQFASREPAKIKAALDALPKDLGDKHRAKFANNLFTRMSGAKPHVKFRYLKAGFDIVGDHPRAAEAKKVFDYYKDLVREIKLDVVVDGSANLAAGKPFGVFVNLNHTRDIERESNGFGRYLQNQNSGGYYSYNYGRPTADYRDRFETAAKDALKEQFEVVSVTFQAETVHSRAMAEFGWRFTPYAYLLLKPRGPQVDAVPPLRLDLDFLDTSGYVVLPVESPKVPIDCKRERPDPRPVKDLTVIQTLDERQANKGVLLLEIKATGVGLVPDAADLYDAPGGGFEVVKSDEQQPLAVKKFDEDKEGNAVLSERSWLLTLQAKPGQPEGPKAFKFASLKLPTKEKDGKLFQRYSDADLVTVDEEVSLEREYASDPGWAPWLTRGAIALGVLLAAAIGLAWWRASRTAAATGPVLPADLNAFTVLQLLERVRAEGHLSATQRAELDAAIAGLERHYFADERAVAPPDLRVIAEKWVVVRA